MCARRPGAGYSLILDAARKQRDPALYRRAVEVALQARSGDAALAAPAPGRRPCPDSPKPALRAADPAGAQPRRRNRPGAARLLEHSSPAERNDAINAIPADLRPRDRQGQGLALQVVREALAPYLNQRAHAAAAWTTLGRMELAQPPAARRWHRPARATRPTRIALPRPAGAGTHGARPARGRSVVRSSCGAPAGRRPPGRRGLAYARMLLDLQRNADARRPAGKPHPQSSPTWPSPGCCWPRCKCRTTPACGHHVAADLHGAGPQAGDERSTRGLTQAYLLMAQIAEKQSDLPGRQRLAGPHRKRRTTSWPRRCAAPRCWPGRARWPGTRPAAQPARTAPGGCAAEAGRRSPAAARLQGLAQGLRGLRRGRAALPEGHRPALRPGHDGREDQPLDDMERLLRQIIAAQTRPPPRLQRPGLLAGRPQLRLPEAKQLIEKAVAMAPDDAYIQDSLGWVEFRLGNTPRRCRSCRRLPASGPTPKSPRTWAKCSGSGPARTGPEDLARRPAAGQRQRNPAKHPAAAARASHEPHRPAAPLWRLLFMALAGPLSCWPPAPHPLCAQPAGGGLERAPGAAVHSEPPQSFSAGLRAQRLPGVGRAATHLSAGQCTLARCAGRPPAPNCARATGHPARLARPAHRRAQGTASAGRRPVRLAAGPAARPAAGQPTSAASRRTDHRAPPPATAHRRTARGFPAMTRQVLPCSVSRRARPGQAQSVPAHRRAARRRLPPAAVGVHADRLVRHCCISSCATDGGSDEKTASPAPAAEDLCVRAARALQAATGCTLGVTSAWTSAFRPRPAWAEALRTPPPACWRSTGSGGWG
jgi:hypothetical protein